MDVNQIFKPVDSSSPADAGVPESQAPNPIPAPPPEDLPSAPPPSRLLKTLKIFIGLIIVVGLFLLIKNVLLPNFLPSKAEKVKLVYWAVFDDPTAMAPIIEEFEKEHPNIDIEYINQEIDQYKEKVITRSYNGNGPDIFRFHNSWIPQLSNLLLPLPKSVITREDLSKNYYPVIVSDLVRGELVYGIPLEIDTLNLFINKDLFQAAGLRAPATWIDFGNFARQLTVKDANNNIKTAGAAMGTYSNITYAPDILSMLLAQNGVNLKDLSSNIPSVADALNFYSSFAIPKANVWDENMEESIKVFASGNLAMHFGYSDDYFMLKSLNPNLSFDVYPVPSLPGQKSTIASYWVEGISSKSQHQNEAALFLRYLTIKENIQKLFTEESKKRVLGKPYPRIDLAGNLSNTILYQFVVSAPSAVSSYFVDGTFDEGLNSKMNEYLKFSIESILKGTSPQFAAETLSQGAAQVLRQYAQ